MRKRESEQRLTKKEREIERGMEEGKGKGQERERLRGGGTEREAGRGSERLTKAEEVDSGSKQGGKGKKIRSRDVEGEQF